MTVISSLVVAVTPSLTTGVVGDLAAMLNFAAVFDVEIVAVNPKVSLVVKDAGAAAELVVPSATAGTTGATGFTDSFADGAAPDLPEVADAIDADSQNAVSQSPALALGSPVAAVPGASQIAPAPVILTGGPGEDIESLIQAPVVRRVPISVPLPRAIVKTKMPIGPAEPTAPENASKTTVADDATQIAPELLLPNVLDRLAPATESGRANLTVPLPGNISVERLLAALTPENPAERQWLDTVIRDVASVAVRSGDVRFRVEPEGLGRMTIERTADRLEISVSEPRSMVIADAARPQVMAGAASFGVPVAGATVVLDQSGQRGRDEGRQRQQIEHRDADETGENHSTESGRYA